MPINFYKDQIHSPPQQFKSAPIMTMSSRKAQRFAQKKHSHAASKAAKSAFEEYSEMVLPEASPSLSKRKAKRQRQAYNKLQRLANNAQIMVTNKNEIITPNPETQVRSQVLVPEELSAPRKPPEPIKEISKTTIPQRSTVYKGAKLCTSITYPIVYTACTLVKVGIGAVNIAKSWTGMGLGAMYVAGGISNNFGIDNMPGKVLGGFATSVNYAGSFTVSHILPMVQSGVEFYIMNAVETTRFGIAAASVGTGLYNASSSFVKAADSKNRLAKTMQGTLVGANLAAAAATPYFLYSTSASYLGMGVAGVSTASLYYASHNLSKVVDSKSYFDKLKHGLVASATLTAAVAVPYYINPFTN